MKAQPISSPERTPPGPPAAAQAAGAPGRPGATGRPGALFFVVLVLLTMIGLMALHLFFPALPGVKAALGVDEGMAQLTISIPLFVMAFLTLVYGSLADRFGRRPVLIGGIALFIAGSALAALADTIWLLLAGRSVQAAGAACGVTLARAIARDVYGADRLVTMIAYMTMAFALGPMLAVPLGGFMVDALGWRSVLIFAAGAGGAILALAYIVIRETRPPDAAPAPGAVRPSLRADYAVLLGNIRFQAFVWQSGASSGAFFVMAPGSAVVMVDYLARTPAEFGLWFPLFPFGFLLGNLVASRLSGRVRVETMVLASGLLLAGAVAILIAFAAADALSPAALFVTGGLTTFAGGVGLSNAQAGAIRLAGNRAGTAAGIGNFLQMFCGAILTQAFGIFADGTIVPFVGVVAFAALLSLVAGLVAYAQRSPRTGG